MHDFVLKIFGALKSFWHFMKIVCVFCIIMLLLFWIQNLTHAHWEWLGFITPFLNWLLDVANNIYSISFNIWGAEFELKYLSAVIILCIIFSYESSNNLNLRVRKRIQEYSFYL